MATTKLTQQHKKLILHSLKVNLKYLLDSNDRAEDSDLKAVYKDRIKINYEAQEAIEITNGAITLKFI